MTLRSSTAMRGFALQARDGAIGKVDRLLFDDVSWTIRYLVANTGTWLARRLVLISPTSLLGVFSEDRVVDVALTRRRIEESPPLDRDRPVSRQKEIELSRHYGYTPYWIGPDLWTGGVYPMPPPPSVSPGAEPASKRSAPAEDRGPSAARRRETGTSDPHLRSTREVRGYAVRARDGEIGHVEDFVIDDRTWRIEFLAVDTVNWWPGKKVLVRPRWIRAVDWSRAAVRVLLARDAIRNGPEYEAQSLGDPEYRRLLAAYHGPRRVDELHRSAT